MQPQKQSKMNHTINKRITRMTADKQRSLSLAELFMKWFEATVSSRQNPGIPMCLGKSLKWQLNN